MPTTTIEIVPPAAPSTDPLIAYERELNELTLEHQALREAWPKAPDPLDRAAIGRKVEDTRKREAMLRLLKPATGARIEMDMPRRLLASALAAIEDRG